MALTKAAQERLRKKADRIAVQCVTIVSLKMIGSGAGTHALLAYDGIQAAREIRELIIKRFS